ncbi:predicted protein [Thalassiosira pseudonana CCMP1335]|uniref:Polysaccharide pyruvyl transferase domain-containing protein n=1 Tax=Thalassiosira pseudonana TaxID=35128 RepID=B8BYG4_THAPS|nr:predicted protein [Thalassiosira pseudonana CCMP1335]EED93883.1 predicted protein [Thalassiosira pseudonana CCMP1335]
MKRDHVANVGQELTRCTLYGYELLCSKVSRTDGSVVSALPRFADYYIDEEKRQWNKSIADETKRIISTGWFQPDQSKCVPLTEWHQTDGTAKNLGDEIGGLMLLLLSGGEPIEKREGKQVGSRYNTTVWGTGTKWGVGGVCFDFRAVRGPKTREVFLKHGCNVPAIYGDPALLLPYFYDPRPYIKVDQTIDLCMIPHMDDYSSIERFEWWWSLVESSPPDISSRFGTIDLTATNQAGGTVRLIDIRTPDAASFVNILSTCKRVASASLHGIILAEAYKIPWSWVQLSGKVEKDFKYHDFFLSVGISPESCKPLRVTSSTTIKEIISHIEIPKQRGQTLYNPISLLDACPFCRTDIVDRLKEEIEDRMSGSRSKSIEQMAFVCPLIWSQ